MNDVLDARRLWTRGATLLAMGMMTACFSVPEPTPGVGGETDSEGDTDEGTSGESSDTAAQEDTANEPEPNTAPQPRADGPYLAPGHQPLEIAAAQGVLLNDEDLDAQDLVVRAEEVVSVAGGAAELEADGGFVYRPPQSLPFGTDRFEYTVLDDRDAEASAEVRVAVGPTDEVRLDALGLQGRALVGTDEGARTGLHLAGVGDLDGDGFDDVALTTMRTVSGEVRQEVVLVYGGPERGDLDLGVVDVRIEGSEGSPIVTAAGDVNGDGFDDLLVGNPEAAAGAGRAYLVLGGALPPLYDLADAPTRFEGIAPDARAGIAVSSAGDVDGDGFDDILIGADRAAPDGLTVTGEAYLVYGRDGLPPVLGLAAADLRLPGRAAGDRAGQTVAGIGDIDGDGFDDLAVAAPLADPGALDRGGEVYLLYGGPGLSGVRPLEQADARLAGLEASVELGTSVAGVGDLNGDDHDDFLVGAPSSPIGPGSAFLVLGRADRASTIDLGDAAIRLDGTTLGDNAGYSVAGAGDVDGDGFADLLVGAHLAEIDGVAQVGASYLLLGRPDPSSTISMASADLRLVGASNKDRVGRAVAGAGDVDGDGFADLLVSADLLDPGGLVDAGAAYVAFGDDLRATVSVLGTSGPDELRATGYDASDVLVGGRGDDLLVSDGGGDVLRGGAGDDRLVLVDDRVFRVDGGRGEDTLELRAGLELDLGASADLRIRGIERIQLALDGPCALSLSAVQVRRASEHGRKLTVDGDEDDRLQLEPGLWLGPASVGEHDVYTLASGGPVSLRVHASIDVSFR